MGKQRWLRVLLAVGGLLFLFWAVFMLFFPGTGHNMMASAQPFDRSTTQMFGGALLALVLGTVMGLRDPIGTKEVVRLMAMAFSIIFLVAIYSMVSGYMDIKPATVGSLLVDGLVALGLILLRP